MPKFSVGTPTEIEMNDLSRDLRDEADGDGWKAYELYPDESDVANQRLQIVWNASAKRAGIVFVGSGSSGHTSWTDATSPEDAVRRYLEDDMCN